MLCLTALGVRLEKLTPEISKHFENHTFTGFRHPADGPDFEVFEQSGQFVASPSTESLKMKSNALTFRSASNGVLNKSRCSARFGIRGEVKNHL